MARIGSRSNVESILLANGVACLQAVPVHGLLLESLTSVGMTGSISQAIFYDDSFDSFVCGSFALLLRLLLSQFCSFLCIQIGLVRVLLRGAFFSQVSIDRASVLLPIADHV